MADNRLSIKLGLESEAYDQGIRQIQEETKAAFDALKVSYQESGAAMAKSLEAVGEVQGFVALQAKTEKAGKAFETAQAKLSLLQAKMAELVPTTEAEAAAFEVLAAKVKLQELAVAKSGEAYGRLKEKLEQTSDQLKASGVDVSKLAEEEKRLADAAKLAQLQHGNLADQMLELKAKGKDLAAQQAKVKASYEVLDIRPFKMIREDIDATREAYDQLRDSGQLSSGELAQAADSARQKIAELNEETTGWMDSLSAAVEEIAKFVAAAAMIAIATHEAILFESAMADVAKVVDFDMPDGFTKLTADIKSLSREIPLTAVELAALAAAGGSMGIATDKLREFIAVGAKISTAFDIPAEDAGKSLGELMNIFGLTVPQVALVGDAMNELGNKLSATEKDILEVTTRAGGMSKTFGLTEVQTAALSATLLSLGRSPEVAATAIGALLSKLQTAKTGSKEFQSALSALGLSADQLADDVSARPQQALSDFLATLKQLDDQSRAEILSKLFGSEYSDDLNLLINGLDEYQKALGYVTEQTQYAGGAQSEFEKRMATTETQLALTQNAFAEAAINVGTVFLPAVQAVAQVVRDATQALADFADTYPALSGLAVVGVTLVTGFAGIHAAALALNIVLGGVFTPLLTNAPITVAAIKTVSGALSLLTAAIAGFAVGFSIGTYLYNEFAVARNAGAAMVAAFLKGWEAIKFGFETAMLAMQYPLDAMLLNLQTSCARVAGVIAAGLRAIGADAVAAQYEKLALSLDKASQKTGEYNDKQTALTASYKAATAQIDEWAVAEFQANAAGEKNVQTQQQLTQASKDAAAGVGSATKAVLDQVNAGNDLVASNVRLRSGLIAMGLDADLVLTGVSSKFAQIKSDFDGVVANANGNSKAIKAAFEQMLKGAETQNEVALVKNAFDEMKKSGVLSAKEIAAEQEKLRSKLVEVEAATDKTAEAFKLLGIESKKALQEKARQSIEALKVVIASGQVSVDELTKAFKRAHEQAVAAGDGTKKAWLEAQAPIHGVKLKTDELVEATRRAGDAGVEAAGKISTGMREAANAANAAKEAISSASSAQSPWRNPDGSKNTGPSGKFTVNVMDQKIRERMANQLGGGDVGLMWKQQSDPAGYKALYELIKQQIESGASSSGGLGRVTNSHQITVVTPTSPRGFQLAADSSAAVGELVSALGGFKARVA
jgi:TP901 family phage tail tape measure protein